MDQHDPVPKVDVSNIFYPSFSLSNEYLSSIDNSQYDNETNFFKRPPPKSTLMDFITTLKISNDNESDKNKERIDVSSKQRPSNGHNQVQVQEQDQDGFDEQIDESEDDPTQANQRERRNPLPPRWIFIFQFSN